MESLNAVPPVAYDSSTARGLFTIYRTLQRQSPLYPINDAQRMPHGVLQPLQLRLKVLKKLVAVIRIEGPTIDAELVGFVLRECDDITSYINGAFGDQLSTLATIVKAAEGLSSVILAQNNGEKYRTHYGTFYQKSSVKYSVENTPDALATLAAWAIANDSAVIFPRELAVEGCKEVISKLNGNRPIKDVLADKEVAPILPPHLQLYNHVTPVFRKA